MTTAIRSRAGERGQVLVVFAGGIVALLLIAALVVDLGFVFMLRRQEQNAADPGAVAAARYIRPSADTNAMRAAACFYARQNGFFQAATSNTGCTPANDTAGATLVVNYPPSAGAGSYAGRSGFVEVVVSRPHRSFLAQLIGLSQITVSTGAVAAYSDGDSNTNTLIALDPEGCGGNAAGVVAGGGTIRITPEIDPDTGLPYDGGYVHVNSTCGSVANQNTTCGNGEGSGALSIDGSGSILDAPKVYVSGTCVKANNNTFSAPLVEGAVQVGDPLADLQPPTIPPGTPGAYCGDPSDPGTPQTNATSSTGCDFRDRDATYNLQPGVYYGGWRINGRNVTLHLAPGVYIIAGGGINLGSTGEITSVESATGVPAPVLIFGTDNPLHACPGAGGQKCQDKINFTAGSELSLRAIDTGPYKGILIWQDGDGSAATASTGQDVVLTGQGALTLSGTIYAPRGVVTLTGGSSGTGYAAVQVISWNWKVSGGGTLLMPYDPKLLYQFDQLGLVR